MKKRLILYTLIFSTIISLITIMIVLNSYDIMYLVFFLPISFFIFLLILIFSIFSPYRKKLKEENNDLVSNCSPLEKIPSTAKLISTWNSIQSLFMNKKDYYFDEQYFYEIAPNRLIKIKLEDITEVNKNSLAVNNRNMWYVKAHIDEQIRTFRFLHNYTLWNKNFPEFLSLVKEINSNAKVRKFNVWTS